MLYAFVKIMMQIAVNLFYKRIFSTGVENIPEKDAAIIIANHPSSLMDAAIIGIYTKRPIYFFARGDIFINRPVHFILKQLHMIPVYHHQQGRDTANHNDESFERAKQILENKGLIVFFPEGSSHTDRKLNPFKKGVFRMAFQTLSAPGFNGKLWIVPAGVNYSHPTASQSIVMINISEPILLNQFLPSYQTNPTATYRSCAQYFHSILLKQVLHIEDDRLQPLADRLLEMNRNNMAHQKYDADIFTAEKKCCDQINNLPENTAKAFEIRTAEYFSLLQAENIPDKIVSTKLSRPGWKKLLMLIVCPLFVPGYILNMPPILFAKKIVDERVYRKDFYSWIYVVSSALLYITWICLFGIIILFLAGWQLMLVALMFIIVTGVITHHILLWAKDLKDEHNYRKFRSKNSSGVKNLKLNRMTVIESARMIM